MSEETKIEVGSNEEDRRKPFRWRRISLIDIFRRTKRDRNFKNFFGLPLDAEPELPETGDYSTKIDCLVILFLKDIEMLKMYSLFSLTLVYEFFRQIFRPMKVLTDIVTNTRRH